MYPNEEVRKKYAKYLHGELHTLKYIYVMIYMEIESKNEWIYVYV